MKQILTSILFFFLTARAAFADPGHGEAVSAGIPWLHYLTSPKHVVPAVLALIAVSLFVLGWARDRDS